jgi:hypothetical protein
MKTSRKTGESRRVGVSLQNPGVACQARKALKAKKPVGNSRLVGVELGGAMRRVSP